MARLFREGSHAALQEELFRLLKPSRLARVRTRHEYDAWLERVVGLSRWRSYSRNGLASDRWGYFAKLINIVVYEIATNRELLGERDWKRLRRFLHIPIDATVLDHLYELDPSFPTPTQLKGMTRKDYWAIQNGVRQLATERHVPPIWFEAAWSV